MANKINDVNDATPQLSLEETIVFYDFLRGERDEMVRSFYPLKLSAEEAFVVVYYLQEVAGIIPDFYEKCDECSELFNTENEGRSGESGFLCGCCLDSKMMKGEIKEQP